VALAVNRAKASRLCGSRGPALSASVESDGVMAAWAAANAGLASVAGQAKVGGVALPADAHHPHATRTASTFSPITSHEHDSRLGPNLSRSHARTSVAFSRRFSGQRSAASDAGVQASRLHAVERVPAHVVYCAAQMIGASYIRITGSVVMSVSPSTRACAIRTLSKGSL